MKKLAKEYKFLYFTGSLLLIGFIVRLGADFLQHQNKTTTTPLFLLVVDRSIFFLLPSILCFIGAVHFKNNNTK